MTGWQLTGYTPVRQLGAGASGSVVLATHDPTGTPVAIKYLTNALGDDASFRAAFRREAQLLGEIDDPNISRLYEYVESTGGAAIVMELVNGVSLRHMLREHGPTTPESALAVLKGSLAGLAAAHRRRVVHRDYKPENVLVTGEGQSKLADFGIATPVGTGTGAIVSGTPRYMAPEQWTGAPATPACDIYAATATFFECLTGRPPYDGTNLFALHDQHANAPIPTDPAPAPVHDLLRHGMAKQPADRPPHAVAFLDILESVAGAAYGPDWEDRGLRELARRAALLAALWPFPDGNSGATSVASTALGGTTAGRPGGSTAGRLGGAAAGRPRGIRGNRKLTVLAAGAAVAALLIGGVGYQYAVAADGKPIVAEGLTTLAPTDPAATGPSAPVPPVASASPAVPASPSVSASPGDSATPADPATATPGTTPSKSPAAPPTTTTPAPSPSVSTSPPPPADTTAPAVGAPTASPTAIEGEGCQYGRRASTITAGVTDDRSAAAALRVTFRYTLNGTTSTVAMKSAGRNVFQGTLGPLPIPKTETRIAVAIVAVDPAGNSGRSRSSATVTLVNFCTPG